MSTTSPTAVAYYRTSSATNVGADKDSMRRQQEACQSVARERGLEIVREYYDAAVSGADALEARPQFREMLSYMLGNGARTIIVETASRFARDIIVQETGYQMLKARGIKLIAADAPDNFLCNTPTADLVRRILSDIAHWEKDMLVDKLRGARDRKSAALGRRCEGNPTWVPVTADVRSVAHDLRRDGLSLGAIGRALAERGMTGASGRPYAAQSVKRMLRAAL